MIPVAHLPDLPRPAAIVTIRESMGGSVDLFGERVRAYIARGTKVRIMGECASACTMVTALPPDRICVGPNAALEFHQAYNVADPKHPSMFDVLHRNEEGVAYLMTFYPQSVKDWIAAMGGLTSELIVLKGDELRAMFKACA